MVTYVFIISCKTPEILEAMKEVFSHEGCGGTCFIDKECAENYKFLGIIIESKVMNNLVLVSLAVVNLSIKPSKSQNADVTTMCLHMMNLA